MEYQEYQQLFRKAAAAGLRNEADMLAENEWMILAKVTQAQMIKRLSQELGEVRT